MMGGARSTRDLTMVKVQDGDTTAVYMVLYEFAGKKPPSTFYNRLHAYGLYSRQPQDTELGVLQWRASRGGSKRSVAQHGIVLQEGIIATSSYDLAQKIAAYAQDMGAEVVKVGHMVVNEFHMNEKDQKVFEELKAKVEKRGPKPKAEAGRYTVTCLDESMSYTVDTDEVPMVCDKCASSNILTRRGALPTFQDFDGEWDEDDPFGYWKRTRFNAGQFEIPKLASNNGKTYAVPKALVPEVELPQLNLPEELFSYCSPQSAPELIVLLSH